VHAVEAELYARNREDVTEVAQRRPDSRREGAAELLQGVALLDLSAIWVSECDADLAAMGALFLDAEP